MSLCIKENNVLKVILPSSLLINICKDIFEQILTQVEYSTDVEVNGKEVLQISTAAIQVLVSLKLYVEKNNKKFSIINSSEYFIEQAKNLNLYDELMKEKKYG